MAANEHESPIPERNYKHSIETKYIGFEKLDCRSRVLHKVRDGTTGEGHDEANGAPKKNGRGRSENHSHNS
jgi:hypothetical protein